MPERLIIDAHHHYQNVPNYPDLLADEYARLGIAKVCLISPGGPDGIERLAEAVRRYPDLILGLAQFDWEHHSPEDIDRFRDLGMAGVKFIRPPSPTTTRPFGRCTRAARSWACRGSFTWGSSVVPRAPA